MVEILDVVIPYLEGEVIIVPLPTIRKHIRERGFDHTKIIARKLARKRGWKTQNVLVRTKNTVQVGADNKKRKEQAKKAFGLRGKIKNDATYLLFDDIWTTGASMMAGAELLKNGGAQKIFGAVIAVSRMRLFASDGFGGITINTDGVKDKVDNCEGKDSNN